jgi:three-Cys-motif partner protein
MTAPHTVRWELEEHTQAKHEILRRYLQAWFPILAKRNSRLAYIDGFAGPGRYKGGEEGSPLIALQAARDHFTRLTDVKLYFLFIEDDSERADWLEHREIPQLKLPGHFVTRVIRRGFADASASVWAWLSRDRLRTLPVFVLADPFGIKSIPFEVLRPFIARPKCEMLITMMTSTIQRFADGLPGHVDAVLGHDGAHRLISAAQGERERRIRDLYTSSLGTAAKYVRFFSVQRAHRRAIYDLFFTTQSIRGLQKMKEVMSAVSVTAAFERAGSDDDSQLALFEPDRSPDLARWLWKRFRGERVSWDAIENAVIVEREHDITADARAALRLLESRDSSMPGHIVVEPRQDGRPRRRGQFPRGTWIVFSA